MAMHRKNIGIVISSSSALMRGSRFLSRLCRDDHFSLYSNSISSPSSSSKLISYTSDSPKEQQNDKIADSHRRLQFNSPHRLTRGDQGFLSSPWRSFLYLVNSSPHVISLPAFCLDSSNIRHSFNRGFLTRTKKLERIEVEDHGQQAVTTALWCNFLVFSLKFGVWLVSSSHVMLAEVVHSVADFANQALLAYGLSSSKRAPDAMHPYGYSKERFVWSLISAVGIFCLGSGATIVHGVQNLWTSQPPENIKYAALVIGGSFIIEGASLLVAIHAVRKGAAAEGMKVRDYVWRGHDPTAVAVMTGRRCSYRPCHCSCIIGCCEYHGECNI